MRIAKKTCHQAGGTKRGGLGHVPGVIPAKNATRGLNSSLFYLPKIETEKKLTSLVQSRKEKPKRLIAKFTTKMNRLPVDQLQEGEVGQLGRLRGNKLQVGGGRFHPTVGDKIGRSVRCENGSARWFVLALWCCMCTYICVYTHKKHSHPKCIDIGARQTVRALHFMK